MRFVCFCSCISCEHISFVLVLGDYRLGRILCIAWRPDGEALVGVRSSTFLRTLLNIPAFMLRATRLLTNPDSKRLIAVQRKAQQTCQETLQALSIFLPCISRATFENHLSMFLTKAASHGKLSSKTMVFQSHRQICPESWNLLTHNGIFEPYLPRLETPACGHHLQILGTGRRVPVLGFLHEVLTTICEYKERGSMTRIGFCIWYFATGAALSQIVKSSVAMP